MRRRRGARPSRVRRRPWLRHGLRAALAVGALVALWGFAWEPGRLTQRDYTLAIPHWPRACDGLRLDVLADIHTGSPHNGLDKLDVIVETLIGSDSDAVLIAGDFVILSVFGGTYIGPEPIAQRLSKLAARKPVYAVLGNHDWWKDGPYIARTFEAAGVRMLEDASTPALLDGCSVAIVGIGDAWEGNPDIPAAYAQVPAGMPVLALTHNPILLRDIPPRTALTLAGHTHGGQVALPLLGRPALWNEEHWGATVGHIVEGGKHLFVTPGIGTSILPLRFGVPPEISRLTLRSLAMPASSGSDAQGRAAFAANAD